MKKRLTLFIAALLLSFSVVQFAPVVTGGSMASAQTSKETVCDAIGSGKNCDGNAGGDLTGVIKTVVNILSVLVGVVAVIMIVWGGFKFITSVGDAQKIAAAKNTIIYALIGLIIVALAQFIIRTVLVQTAKTVSTPAAPATPKKP